MNFENFLPSIPKVYSKKAIEIIVERAFIEAIRLRDREGRLLLLDPHQEIQEVLNKTSNGLDLLL